MSNSIDDRVLRLEQKVSDMEVMSARVEERITTLADACDSLRKTVWYFMFIFGLLMFGVIAYGAIGERGLHSVRENLAPIAQQATK